MTVRKQQRAPAATCRPVLIVVVAALLFTGACGRTQEQIVDVPDPHALDLMESGVQQQYQQLRQKIEILTAALPNDPEKIGAEHGRLGMWFQTYGHFSEAQQCYANARARAGQDFRWPYYQGHAFRAAGRRPEAYEAFNDALEIEPEHLQSRLWRGQTAAESGDQQNAEHDFRQVLERDPELVRAIVGLARLELEGGHAAAALLYLENAAALQNNSTEINLLLGQTHRSLGDTETAIAFFDRGVAEESGEKVEIITADPLLAELAAMEVSSEALMRRGRQARHEGYQLQALKLFDRAVQAAPGNPAARLEYGLALLHAGNAPAALVEFEAGLRLEPFNAAMHLRLAAALQQVGRTDEARAHIELGLGYAPNDREVQLVAGKLWLVFGEPALSFRCFDVASELAPGCTPACVGRTLALVRLGRYVEARDHLEKDLKNSNAIELRTLLVRLLAASPDQAARNGARALDIAQGLFAEISTITAAESMAMACAELGDFEQAMAWQKRCVVSADVGSLPRVRERLMSYSEMKPCRIPWTSDERLDNPARVEKPSNSG